MLIQIINAVVIVLGRNINNYLPKIKHIETIGIESINPNLKPTFSCIQTKLTK